MGRQRAQSLAATNRELAPLVKSVLVEVLTGVSRSRSTTEPYRVDIVTAGGKLYAHVHNSQGGHCGTWEIVAHAA